jgi:hypothetical protein
MKSAQDTRGADLQFSSFETEAYQNITGSAQIDTEYTAHVDITPVAEDAWIRVTAANLGTNTSGVGKLIPAGSFRSVRIPKGYYLTSSSEINVVPYGN